VRLLQVIASISTTLLTPGWRQAPAAPGIGVRNGHAMVYDAAVGRVVSYGGANASEVLGDTWTWDGDARTWRLLAGTGPGPRTFPAMAYDARRRQTILFGGNRVLFGRNDEDASFLSDTWSLQEGRWTVRRATGPAPRAEAGMAYDARRGRVVLFGGHRRTAEGRIRLGDTWEWDGERWTEMAAKGPAPRSGAAFAYDERRERIVLFGGSGASNDTWEWDGIQWTPAPAGDPPGRFNAAMAFDGRAGVLLRFGGWTGTTRVGDTWTLLRGTWERLPVQGPSARNHSPMAFDRRRNRVVLFGGHDGEYVFGDTWEWDGRRWIQAGFTARQKRVDNGH
jgi:hypothetical protein